MRSDGTLATLARHTPSKGKTLCEHTPQRFWGVHPGAPFRATWMGQNCPPEQWTCWAPALPARQTGVMLTRHLWFWRQHIQCPGYHSDPPTPWGGSFWFREGLEQRRCHRCRLWSRVLFLGPCDMAETLWLEVPKLNKRCQGERSARPDKCIAGQTPSPKGSTVGKLPGLGRNRTSNHGTWADNGTSTSGILARKKKEWKSEPWYTMEEPWRHGAQLKERIQTAISCLISFVRSVWKRQIHTKSK